MQQRLTAIFALAAFGLLIVALLVWRGGDAAPGSDRVSFQIATGAGGGTFFEVGQAMAALLSHPPGVGRCETSTVCGPAGVILSTRTSQGGLASLRAVNDGLVDSGFVQGALVDAAVHGTGEFRRRGPQRHIRVIAALFAEPMHLVVAAKSPINSVADLRGRRVALGGAGSGTQVMARQILAAFDLPLFAIRRVEGDDPPALMAAGKLDAFFTTAGAPFDPITQLIASGKARLVAISGPQVEQLVANGPQLEAATIADGTYPHTGAVATIATRAFWIARDNAPDTLIYGLTRALFNPANRAALNQSHPSARQIDAASATLDLPGPLHPGAARYYREAKVLSGS